MNRALNFGFWSLIALCCGATFSFAQEKPPAPSAPKSVKVPAVKESQLKNYLTVAVVERSNVPIVTVQLLIKSGANAEDTDKAGLANMTADLLTKGTKTRTATQIAEQLEFLGATINTGAGWNNSIVTVTVTADKLDAAMAIMSDVVLNPTFKQTEIDLLKSQTLDGLTYNLSQPGFLSNYVASVYSFREHPIGGTPESLKAISRADIIDFQKENYTSSFSVLIFTGDITAIKAKGLAQKYFGRWKAKEFIQTVEETPYIPDRVPVSTTSSQNAKQAKRILVVDLPNAGQASVIYTKFAESGRVRFDEGKISLNKTYYPALVLNSVLGGGYSSRLNQEIRIKRGLSYGAGSNFGWRLDSGNFATRTQTKNESAAEVAELVLGEVNRLADESITDTELVPRKSVLTGNFGRELETTEGLAAAVADLYTFNLPTNELNSYDKNVLSVKDAQIKDFAAQNLRGGDIIIVGDYAKFKDDLAKRFPKTNVEVVKADDLDISRENLRKQ